MGERSWGWCGGKFKKKKKRGKKKEKEKKCSLTFIDLKAFNQKKLKRIMGDWIRVRGDCWLFVPEFAFSYNFFLLFSSFIILLLSLLLFDDDNSSILLFCSLTITVFRLSREKGIRNSIVSPFSILFWKSVFGFF